MIAAPAALLSAPLALPVLAGTGLFAAWSDVRYRRLPNWLAGLVAASGLAAAAWYGGLTVAASAALHAAIAFVIGVALYSRGIMGGGDIKYYTGIAAWFPMHLALRLLGSVSLAGFMLALGWLLWRRLSNRPADAQAGTDRDKLPFGVAIAAGALLAVLGS